MLFFIINPLAGRGHGLTVWKKIEEDSRTFLESEGFRVFYTEGRGNAKTIAREITEDSRGEKKIVVIGGTGETGWRQSLSCFPSGLQGK